MGGFTWCRFAATFCPRKVIRNPFWYKKCADTHFESTRARKNSACCSCYFGIRTAGLGHDVTVHRIAPSLVVLVVVVVVVVQLGHGHSGNRNSYQERLRLSQFSGIESRFESLNCTDSLTSGRQQFKLQLIHVYRDDHDFAFTKPHFRVYTGSSEIRQIAVGIPTLARSRKAVPEMWTRRRN
eukprot:1112156-Rhodomonas_salina.1